MLSILSNWSLLWTGLVGLLFVYIWRFAQNHRRMRTLLKNVPTQPSWPLLGNLELYTFTRIWRLLRGLVTRYRQEGLFVLWTGWKPIIVVYKAEILEPLMKEHLQKCFIYKVGKPWLGNGVATCQVDEWKIRRKLINPAFHITILKTFMPIYNEKSKTLVRTLERQAETREFFDIEHFLGHCALDIICETGMGLKMDVQESKGESAYLQCLNKVQALLTMRGGSPLLWPDLIFRFSKHYKPQKKYIGMLHSFTTDVIQKRREELESEKSRSNGSVAAHANDASQRITNANDTSQKIANGSSMCTRSVSSSTTNGSDAHQTIADGSAASVCKKDIANRSYTNGSAVAGSDANEEVIGIKKRLALLDLLLETSANGVPLSNTHIREEVDAIMFAGHDTVSCATSWLLYLLGCHPEIQQKVYEELDFVFGEDQTSEVTMDHLKDLKYLECTIKEALRMFPPAPYIGRDLEEDFEAGPYTIPAGTSVFIFIYQLHRNPEVFPEPEKFNPDRFLPENSAGLHPFAFMPFSGGPRNCLGHKYAMMEMKVMMSHVLRAFRVTSKDSLGSIRFVPNIILRSTNGIHIKLTKRKQSD